MTFTSEPVGSVLYVLNSSGHWHQRFERALLCMYEREHTEKKRQAAAERKLNDIDIQKKFISNFNHFVFNIQLVSNI